MKTFNVLINMSLVFAVMIQAKADTGDLTKFLNAGSSIKFQMPVTFPPGKDIATFDMGGNQTDSLNNDNGCSLQLDPLADDGSLRQLDPRDLVIDLAHSYAAHVPVSINCMGDGCDPKQTDVVSFSIQGDKIVRSVECHITHATLGNVYTDFVPMNRDEMDQIIHKFHFLQLTNAAPNPLKI